MTDELKEAVTWLEAMALSAESMGPDVKLSFTADKGALARAVRLVLSALKAAERPQPVPGDGEGVKGRNIADAAQSVSRMDDERIALFAQRDPDIFRDIARSVSQPGCGATECLNRCDGDFTHETCPNAAHAAARAPVDVGGVLNALWSWAMQSHPDAYVDWLIEQRTPGFEQEPREVWIGRYRAVLDQVAAALSRVSTPGRSIQSSVGSPPEGGTPSPSDGQVLRDGGAE